MFEKNEFESLMLDSPESPPVTDEEINRMAEYFGYGLDPVSEFD